MSSGADEYWKARRKEREARQRLNLEILEEIKQFIKTSPDQRFTQALTNLGLGDCKDTYHHEPDETLERVKYNKSIIKEKAKS